MKRRTLFALALIALTFSFTGLTEAQQQPPKGEKAKVLLFTRSQGYVHSPARSRGDDLSICGAGLKAYFDDKNVEMVETQDGRVFDGDIDQYDGFIFYTSGNLRAEIDRNNKDSEKNPNAKPMTDAGFRKLLNAVKNGKGFVGIHSATDTECGLKNEAGTDLYTAFVGARFAGHGPQQFATAIPTEAIQLPWIKDSGTRITNFEEWYTNRNHAKDLHVVLYQNPEGMAGREHQRPAYPFAWIRAEGKGRVGYAGYGHNDDFWRSKDMVRKFGELVEWSVGRFDMDTTPNIDKVTPGANKLAR